MQGIQFIRRFAFKTRLYPHVFEHINWFSTGNIKDTFNENLINKRITLTIKTPNSLCSKELSKFVIR